MKYQTICIAWFIQIQIQKKRKKKRIKETKKKKRKQIFVESNTCIFYIENF